MTFILINDNYTSSVINVIIGLLGIIFYDKHLPHYFLDILCFFNDIIHERLLLLN